MKYLPSLPSPASRRSLLLSPWITLLSSVLFCASPALTAQSVTFAGAQTTLPFSGLNMPVEVALDSAGDVFVSDNVNNRVVELPRTATGYGPQMTLPVAVAGPTGITLDNAGDLFIADDTPNNYSVVEFPWTPTGYGPQITLSFSGLNQPAGLAVDSAGDLFLSDYGNGVAAELPKTGTGYGAQVACRSPASLASIPSEQFP
jgi:DNA-binding beta-propeller fold protein YncE